MQALYLLNQHENRLPGRAQIGTTIRRQTRAPRAELFDLRLVQTIAQDAPVYDDFVAGQRGRTRNGLCFGPPEPQFLTHDSIGRRRRDALVAPPPIPRLGAAPDAQLNAGQSGAGAADSRSGATRHIRAYYEHCLAASRTRTGDLLGAISSEGGEVTGVRLRRVNFL
jgi:hypothetical protein